MKKAAILIIISLLAANCYLPAPPVDCEFIGIKKETEVGLYRTEHFMLKFKSTHNLATFSKEYNGVHMLLYCPLSDGDYVNNHRDSRFQICDVMSVSSWYDDGATIPIYFNKGWYYYEFPIDFEDNINSSRSLELSDSRIDSVLNDKDCVPCNFVMPYFALNRPFHTDMFCIPADSIRKLLIVDKLENK